MKILHIYKTYYPENFTGVPRVILELSEGLADEGVESHVLALYERGNADPVTLGRHIVHQAKRNFDIASTSLSFDIFRRFRSLAAMADVVHYHFPWPLADLLYFVHGRKKPAIVTYHSDIVKQRRLLPFYAPVMHGFLRRVQRIVATSPNYADSSPVLPLYREKLSVIPIGIRERTLPEPGLISQWRQRLGDRFFLFVGALRYYKGLPFLIEAARRTGFPVVVAGEGDSSGWHVPKNVTFTGVVSDEDREALLELCTAFAFPSHLRSEAFGIALLEAARASKPMISCEMGSGTSYVNADGQSGITVAPADTQALATAMTWLAENPDEAARMGRNARSRFERLFRSEEMCRAYLRHYVRLAAKPPR